MSTITDADHIAHIEREWYEHLMERATWSESCAPATRRHIADQLARMLARGRVESSALAEGDLLIVDAPDLLAAGGLTRRTSQAVIARHHLLRSVVECQTLPDPVGMKELVVDAYNRVCPKSWRYDFVVPRGSIDQTVRWRVTGDGLIAVNNSAWARGSFEVAPGAAAPVVAVPAPVVVPAPAPAAPVLNAAEANWAPEGDVGRFLCMGCFGNFSAGNAPVPCGHVTLCDACIAAYTGMGANLPPGGLYRCPSCRVPVTGHMRVFA
jgi:hypothetical protein